MIFIPGVRKCGTTTLFRALEAHTQVRAASIKEPQYFALSENTIASNLDWYRTLYGHADNMTLMDGSTLCFTCPSSAQMIDEFIPNVKILIVLRDPAKRAYSAYLHMSRQVHKGGESRKFHQILEAIESRSSGTSVVEREREVIQQCAANGDINGEYYTSNFHKQSYDAPFETDFADMLIGYRYFEESTYSRFISAYDDIFGDRMKIILFEELVKKPAETIRQVMEFSGLEIQEEILELPHENKGRVPRHKIAEKLIWLRHNNQLMQAIASAIKASPLAGLGKGLRQALWQEQISLDEQLRVRTRMLLKDEYDYWHERYPETTNLWLKLDNPTERS